MIPWRDFQKIKYYLPHLARGIQYTEPNCLFPSLKWRDRGKKWKCEHLDLILSLRLTKMADWPRQLCSPGQMLTRTLEISKIPSQDQKLRGFFTILHHQNLVCQQLTNLLQNGNGPNFWSRGGIFKKSSPVFLIWPGEDNVLSQIAYIQL